MLTHPEIIIYNGRIFDRPRSDSALAIVGERILKIGNDDQIKSLSGPDTQLINARGRWLLPALTEGHAHLTATAVRKLQVELTGCGSLNEALRKIRKKVEETPEGQWVWGGGWDTNIWGLNRFPSREELDTISTRHFIALGSKDGHCLWVNSPVLRKFNITSALADPPGGRIVRDRKGQPEGVLLETARDPVFRAKEPPPAAELIPALKETFQDFHREGITAVHCMETPDEFYRYRQLLGENALGLRIFLYLPVRFLPHLTALGISNDPDTNLKFCGIKLFADGTLSSRTADMLENYEGTENRGLATLSGEELQHHISAASASGLACAVHAIGDAANRKVLDAFEKALPASQKHRLQHRIEHAQLLHPVDIPRFAGLNITASMQPIHLAADIPLISKQWGSRGRFAYAFNSLSRAGARLMFGSDTPIESFSPWKGMYCAICRRATAGPDTPSFVAEEGIDLTGAIHAYSRNSAETVGMASDLGTVAPGKLADVIIIDRDIFREPPEVLLETGVVCTIQAGKIVHRTE